MRARAGIEVEGLHVHVGSQLLDARAHLQAVELLADFAGRARDELDWTPAIVDVGGGFGIRYVLDEPEPPLEQLVRSIVDAVGGAWEARGLPQPRLILEPGRSLVGPAACTLYTIGATKRAGDRSYVAIDGGMSDNPRPQLYDARFAALLANRADEEPADEPFTVAGKHCESGDVLIESVPPTRATAWRPARIVDAVDGACKARLPTAPRDPGAGTLVVARFGMHAVHGGREHASRRSELRRHRTVACPTTRAHSSTTPRYAALPRIPGRRASAADPFTVAGKHCESGNILIESVRLPEPRRGDLLAVPATGAYTLAMGSTYNGVPRPAAVLVRDGEAREILRRETVEDLLAREV